jgi:hypothetical protein
MSEVPAAKRFKAKIEVTTVLEFTVLAESREDALAIAKENAEKIAEGKEYNRDRVCGMSDTVGMKVLEIKEEYI